MGCVTTDERVVWCGDVCTGRAHRARGRRKCGVVWCECEATEWCPGHGRTRGRRRGRQVGSGLWPQPRGDALVLFPPAVFASRTFSSPKRGRRVGPSSWNRLPNLALLPTQAIINFRAPPTTRVARGIAIL